MDHKPMLMMYAAKFTAGNEDGVCSKPYCWVDTDRHQHRVLRLSKAAPLPSNDVTVYAFCSAIFCPRLLLQFSMQNPPRGSTFESRPAAPHDAIKLTVRNSRGDASQLFAVEAPASSTIADVKKLLCRQPHNICSNASALVLVLKGKGCNAAHEIFQL